MPDVFKAKSVGEIIDPRKVHAVDAKRLNAANYTLKKIKVIPGSKDVRFRLIQGSAMQQQYATGLSVITKTKAAVQRRTTYEALRGQTLNWRGAHSMKVLEILFALFYKAHTIDPWVMGMYRLLLDFARFQWAGVEQRHAIYIAYNNGTEEEKDRNLGAYTRALRALESLGYTLVDCNKVSYVTETGEEKHWEFPLKGPMQEEQQNQLEADRLVRSHFAHDIRHRTVSASIYDAVSEKRRDGLEPREDFKGITLERGLINVDLDATRKAWEHLGGQLQQCNDDEERKQLYLKRGILECWTCGGMFSRERAHRKG